MPLIARLPGCRGCERAGECRRERASCGSKVLAHFRLLGHTDQSAERAVAAGVTGAQVAVQVMEKLTHTVKSVVVRFLHPPPQNPKQLVRLVGQAADIRATRRGMRVLTVVRLGHDASDSTRRFRPLSALSMMTFSAFRFSMPIMGMAMSTARRYVTSVWPLPWESSS